MKQVFSFLMVGLAFTALQVATAEAADTSHKGNQGQHHDDKGAAATQGFAGKQHHDGSQGQHKYDGAQGGQHHDGAQGQHKYDGARGGQHHDGAQGQQHHDDMKAQQHYDDMGNKGQQHHEGTQGNAAQGFSGEHQDKGGHHDGPPIDPRSGQPFTAADEAKFEKYVVECDATKGVLSDVSANELVAEGFTRIQVDKLCKDGQEQGSGGHDGHPSTAAPR